MKFNANEWMNECTYERNEMNENNEMKWNVCMNEMHEMKK